MPTGYTAYIESGEITTGKDFLTLCTRAFGIAMDMRDEPLSVPTPTQFKPHPYHLNAYNEALADLEKIKSMTIDEARYHMMVEHDDGVKHYEDLIRKTELSNARLDSIRNDIVNWTPPTADHRELKQFALNQIDISIESTIYYQQALDKLGRDLDISDESVEAYISDKIRSAEKDVEYHHERYQEELKRTADKNRWISEFYKSIE